MHKSRLVTDTAYRIRTTPQKDVAWGVCGKQFGEKEVCWRTHPPVGTFSSHRPRLLRDEGSGITKRTIFRESATRLYNTTLILAEYRTLAEDKIHRSWRFLQYPPTGS